MQILRLLFLLSILPIASCNLDLDFSEENEDNSSAEAKEKIQIEPKPKDEISKVVPPSPTKNENVEKNKPTVTKLNPPTPQKPKITPIEPEFSNELLRAVRNWTRIPDTVFPLKNVSVSEEVTFKLVGQQNQVIASSVFPPGKEVVAKGIQGNTLLISPSLESKLKGTIAMEKTDFKKCVAFRFDMGKRIIKMREEMRKKQAVSRKNATNATPSNESKNESTSLFDDLPSPGDFGHGKFCVCTECREKRLALTGTIR